MTEHTPPIIMRVVRDVPVWCLWLPLNVAERAGYGQCASVRGACARGEPGAWIAFPSYAYAECVWRQIRVSHVARYN